MTSLSSAGPYRAGTLSYTRAGLVALFCWLLWGDFCYILMEQVMPQLLPLLLNRFGASNKLISLFVVMMPELVYLVLCPIISTASDRTRTRWGRRRPYLLFSAPFVGLFLALLGWSREIGEWAAAGLFQGTLPVTTVIIGVAALLTLSYKIFDIFCTSVLYYIFNDVVPVQFIGRFMAMFRMVGVAATFLFQRYIMQFSDAYLPWIFTGVGILYIIGMTTMCLRVKEGEYPPPDPEEKRNGFLGNLKLYFRECYSLPFYVWFFLGVSINTVSGACRSVFNILFATKELSMSVGEFGVAMSYYSLVIFLLMFPAGMLADRIHPLMMYIVGGLLIALANWIGFHSVTGYHSFLAMTVVLALVYVLQTASYLPMHMKILPKEKYGQFCSAGVIVRAILMISVSGLSGWFIDLAGSYRYLYIWDLFFTLLGTACLWMAWRGYRRYGGADGNYVPPLPPAASAADLHKERSLS